MVKDLNHSCVKDYGIMHVCIDVVRKGTTLERHANLVLRILG